MIIISILILLISLIYSKFYDTDPLKQVIIKTKHGECKEYYGTYNKHNKKHGNRTSTYNRHSKYDDEWKNDKKEGHGIYTWANGDKYDGEWKNNISEGYGIYSWANGDKYYGNLRTWKIYMG